MVCVVKCARNDCCVAAGWQCIFTVSNRFTAVSRERTAEVQVAGCVCFHWKGVNELWQPSSSMSSALRCFLERGRGR